MANIGEDCDDPVRWTENSAQGVDDYGDPLSHIDDEECIDHLDRRRRATRELRPVA